MNAGVDCIHRPQRIRGIRGPIYSKRIVQYTSQGSSRIEWSIDGEVARSGVNRSYESRHRFHRVLGNVNETRDVLVVDPVAENLVMLTSNDTENHARL